MGDGMTRRAIGLALVAGLALLTPADASDSPYVIRLDLRADIRALGSDDMFVSEPAADHLTALGTIALPALAAALRREPPATRVGVVGVLQQIEGEQATQLLIEAADDREPAVRADALLALGLRRDAAGAAVVERHLRDPDRKARRSAALACNAVCASPAALARLVEIAMHDSEAVSAQQSLRSIASDANRAATARAAIEQQALPVLAAADADPLLRANAAITAAIAGRREAVPALLEATVREPKPGMRSLAVLALGGVPDPDAVTALAQIAQGGEGAPRDDACAALAQLRARGVEGAAAASACPTPSADHQKTTGAANDHPRR